MLGLVNRPNGISLSRANQSQAKFKSSVGGNLLQSWVNLTIELVSLSRIALEFSPLLLASLDRYQSSSRKRIDGVRAFLAFADPTAQKEGKRRWKCSGRRDLGEYTSFASAFWGNYLSLKYYELATCIPPSMSRPRSTRQASFAHSYCVELSNVRINRFSDGFFLSTSCLWNSLPSSVFLASVNLPSFKRQDYYHLGTRWHDFFFFFFLCICFILFIAFLFHFLRDANSTKGTLCPFCVPIHKEKTGH